MSEDSNTIVEVLTSNLDHTGLRIPESILSDWKRAHETGHSLQTTLDELIEILEQGLRDGDVIFAELHDASDCKAARETFSRIIPYAVCTSCQGMVREKCSFCRGRGFISKFLWDICVPEKIKEIRLAITGKTKQEGHEDANS